MTFPISNGDFPVRYMFAITRGYSVICFQPYHVMPEMLVFFPLPGMEAKSQNSLVVSSSNQFLRLERNHFTDISAADAVVHWQVGLPEGTQSIIGLHILICVI